ncbi:HNH endonuclease [Pseudomonas sp. CC120222-01a]|uniref:HNH endonuclease n=1 Tax=Pseudomonas sp. CC120222-01a TaxID=1378075 RepID=UPI000D8FD198|nr:HNH endonuclease [Pseudomonas sp. CC120222-01a]PVZ43914.1 uncharacterized protein (TIGR02646 family) [Pseudomonas sp. CC120222-01a]
MIKLTKLEAPQVLTDNFNNWTNTILEKIEKGEAPTNTEKSRYRHKDIKARLEEETNGKCAYCESKLKHIHHGDVEHIFPKSLDPSRQFEWSNLTLACEICNQNKTNRDPTLEYIIDPYAIDPCDHIYFTGGIAYPLGTPEGISSITLLDLNRPALILTRTEKVQKVMHIFDTILRNDLPIQAKKAIYNDLLSNECSNKSQYSAVAKSLIDAMKPKLPADIFN